MIIVITGPTCTHKSEIAIKVAKALKGEIINADAFQVYKELKIGTAKPSKEQLKEVKHHLYSYKSIDDPFSIFNYQKDAREVIDKLLKQNKPVIMVGGSGLYIRAALYDYSFNETPKKKVSLKKYEKLTNEKLHDELKKIDPESANKIHPNNRRRVLRAIEIYLTYKKSKSEIEKEQQHKLIYDDVLLYSTFSSDMDGLYNSINNRVDKMFEAGLVKEVLTLKKKHEKNQALQAIGYKEIIDNPEDLELAKELIKKNTRHYAKRQLTFNRYQYPDMVHFIEGLDSYQIILNDVKKLVDDKDIYSRTRTLIGAKNLTKLKHAHVAVFGVGGVGGTALEALARSGIGELTFVDYDVVKNSNLNRQILFTANSLHQKKVDEANVRIKSINPEIITHPSNLCFSKLSIDKINFDKFDFVIDAIDSMVDKKLLITTLLNKKIPFVSSLGMGNRLDPSKLVVTTLDKTHDDPLAKKLRHDLKQDNVDIRKIKVVTSNEIPLVKNRVISSMMLVPSAAGLLLASEAIKYILK